MKKAVFILAVLMGMAYTMTAGAHVTIAHKSFKKMTLAQVEQYQLRVISLDRWILRTAKVHDAEVVRWHRQQLKWTLRELKETRARITPPIAHRALWLCLHPHESSDWHNQDSGHNGHYGGLQMSWGWLGYFSGNPARFSPDQQMQFAEKGYRDSGYSSRWLWGQWGQTLGFCTQHM